ncbi:hypothetical protein PACTADRAFT_343 [Pachysolen tannophilus NRRL Y-2460]|uniref:ER membrane protein complex subunit 4 n=1 Tax=Pachysolen tannophilus NRRL Y-2460 TaxID=669874 RepID=A0A1E4U1F9_PACTA|nr:hypothetical protein PACTADRAFT_343 [Pachysolen tannophilus NRRL Y-2460]
MSYSWEQLYENPDLKVNQPSKEKIIPSPPGFSEIKRNKNEPTLNTIKNFDLEKLKQKKAWEMAFSPAKNIPMNLIMSYFSPNSLQLIPIMMTLMLFINPGKEIFFGLKNLNLMETKSSYDLILMKACFILMCLGNMLIGVWKLNSMGLIPNTKSDWLSWESAVKVEEKSWLA